MPARDTKVNTAIPPVEATTTLPWPVKEVANYVSSLQRRSRLARHGIHVATRTARQIPGVNGALRVLDAVVKGQSRPTP